MPAAAGAWISAELDVEPRDDDVTGEVLESAVYVDTAYGCWSEDEGGH